MFNFAKHLTFDPPKHELNNLTDTNLTVFRQWCYWQVTRLTDGDYDKYSTFHDHPGVEALYNDDGIKFSIRSKTCAFSHFPVLSL